MIGGIIKSVQLVFRESKESSWEMLIFFIKFTVITVMSYIIWVAIYIWSLDCVKCPY